MKKLGLQMKGSPYPMTASQENIDEQEILDALSFL